MSDFGTPSGTHFAAQSDPPIDDQDDTTDPDDPNKKQRETSAMYSYCEADNCYDVLGVKRTTPQFQIKRAYRRLAAENHPDKNPSPRAHKLFQKYTTAYEVLSDPEMRKNYEYFLDHPFEFPMHYMRYGSGKYAPKTDLRMVLLLILLGGSAAQYLYRDRMRKDLLHNAKNSRAYTERLRGIVSTLSESKSPSRGGSTKAKAKDAKANAELRAKAETILLDELMAELPPMPSFEDTLLWQTFCFPVNGSRALVSSLTWFVKFSLLGQEYGAAEKEYLTIQVVGQETWEDSNEAERDAFVSRELWIDSNRLAYAKETSRGVKVLGGMKKKKAAAEAAMYRLSSGD